MASNPLEKHNEHLRELLKKSKEKGVEKLVPPANKLLATVRNRIQQDGEKTDGNKIGSYSTKDIYASRGEFDKKKSFKPQGKNGKRKGAKTMYLPGGYKQLRDIQGKPTTFINLTYRGDLINAYQQQVKTNEIVQGLIREQEALKRKGLEKRFGKILTPQSDEMEAYKKEVAQIVKEEVLKPFKFA